jgi:hypothetical protein
VRREFRCFNEFDLADGFRSGAYGLPRAQLETLDRTRFVARHFRSDGNCKKSFRLAVHSPFTWHGDRHGFELRQRFRTRALGNVVARRMRLLAAVTQRGFIDDYSGVRISKTGRHFNISRATVWNLLTEDGQLCGQAAMFVQWEFL